MSERIELLIRGLEFRRDRVLNFEEWAGEQDFKVSARFHRLVAEFVDFVMKAPEVADTFCDLVRHTERVERAVLTKERQNRIGADLRALADQLVSSQEWKHVSETPMATMPEHLARKEFLDFLSDSSEFIEREKLLSTMTQGGWICFPGFGQTGRASDCVHFLRDTDRDLCRVIPPDRIAWRSPWIDRLTCVEREIAALAAAYDFDGDYAGAQAAALLETSYLALHPLGITRMWDDPVRDIARAEYEGEIGSGGNRTGGSRTELQDACRLVAHVLSQAALRTRGRHNVVDRFARFCSWYARDHLVDVLSSRDRASTRKEAKLHAFMNEFLFRDGYLPLAEVSLGKWRRADTLAQRRVLEDAQRQPKDDFLLIEVKQSVGQNLTDSEFSKFVGQAATYAAEIAAFLPALDRTVYLVIFHDRAFNYSAEQAIEHGGAQVRPVFVDLAREPVSTRKPRVLEFRAAEPRRATTKK